jgi:hypothetical protein
MSKRGAAENRSTRVKSNPPIENAILLGPYRLSPIERAELLEIYHPHFLDFLDPRIIKCKPPLEYLYYWNRHAGKAPENLVEYKEYLTFFSRLYSRRHDFESLDIVDAALESANGFAGGKIKRKTRKKMKTRKRNTKK